ncbi:MAG: hypothetical protein COX79_03365 [Candidatus Levybacteria bacterium CG_4_10_14_0_2_um_filter_36_16]|nr:MAG: hypothetical protein AUK12_01760 [Candidatus Levybacteria bacterium CG2_30_37_29]PIR79206.1 MAG: hypothetical protein COU26_02375 [Candidatus Levybacteria bacterium CG10_big_fil_rev_8_21_14_0_10_36_30]PIZ97080.1 MAG: hypothetical protein COX79_03365 [Candidatus Levybacteria bacterium CG_4_10_14_0_2_um_filter_36_16]
MPKKFYPSKKSLRKIFRKKHAFRIATSSFWFVVGFFIAALLLGGILIAIFQYRYQGKVIPGVFIGNTYVGGKTEEEVKELFNTRNKEFEKSLFVLTLDDFVATISARDLKIGYDSNLIAEQAESLGKSNNILSNIYLILSSYTYGTFLKQSHTFDPVILNTTLADLDKKVYTEPVDALFTVENKRVVAFRQSSEGKTIDYDALIKKVSEKQEEVIQNKNSKIIGIKIPVKILKPQVTTEKANTLGIVEEIGQGNSQFQHSIQNRVYNISLAASRINGVLVAPNETFSFAQALGDISKYTGYKEAYVIKDGKTILGDGGGVCQVSTTLFRAILNAGLPITERHAHAYRVGYYEQDSPPGLDATVFVPNIDLKFKNDTGAYILIQSYVDPTNLTLRFTLYGKRDNREVTITKPVITNQSPPPPPRYQDDPTLPKGEVRQVDFEAPGAKATFWRTVTKNGNVIISENYISNYAPWQSVFLKGTKE